MRLNLIPVCALAMATSTGLAGVVTLSATMTADNLFSAYVSDKADAVGASFLNGGSWPTTYNGSTDLTTPGTYYLHIRAEDVGRPAMLIGNFTLTGDDATFSNGTQQLLTDASTGDWSASLSGFGGPSVGVIDLGANGTGPWGNFPAMGDARFIWAEGSPSPLVAYFRTTITILPAPSGLGALAFVGLAATRRRR